MNLELKYKTISLRKEGRTYAEIIQKLGYIPKSTLSNWLQSVDLTRAQKKRIYEKILTRGNKGRQKGAWINHRKRLQRIEKIRDTARKEFMKFKDDTLFITGLVLYLAEGVKKMERFQFMNSDPLLISMMLNWLQKIIQIPLDQITFRLYIHKTYLNEECEKLWSNLLNIPKTQFKKTVYKPTPHKIKKNPEYKGCIRVEIPGTEIHWKIMTWRDMLYQIF